MLQTRSLTEGATRLLKNPLLHPLNDVQALDDLLAQFNPAWSLTRTTARVVEIRDETSDVKTFVLRPNRRWHGHAAGQHVVIECEFDGVRLHRTFSIASAPQQQDTIELTVKRMPHGKVTGALHERLRVGDVLALGEAAGHFVLPTRLPERLLMLSAGSGITPVMSMLRDLHRRGHDGRIVFVHVCRTPADAIFAGELRQLAARMPNLRVHWHFDSTAGRFDVKSLSRLVPDYSRRHTFLCGPAGFMQTFQQHWQEEHPDSILQYEQFGLPLTPRPAGEPVEIRATRSERLFASTGQQPLLMDAEVAGLQPKYGCRIGICQTCKCRKTSGTVENLLTGKISSEPGEMIQLCISAARSDVTLEL
jgi:stearoyl-CoA 9-desaturase NADPH oxidoreductase